MIGLLGSLLMEKEFFRLLFLRKVSTYLRNANPATVLQELTLVTSCDSASLPEDVWISFHFIITLKRTIERAACPPLKLNRTSTWINSFLLSTSLAD